MASTSQYDLAVKNLQSSAKCELLDAIDRLRAQGFQEEIELPQLIICGNQSAGKSSVLEAISQGRFPEGTGCKTKFASELVLRRATCVSCTVRIEAAPNTSEDEEAHLAQFNVEYVGAQAFLQAIEDVAQHIDKFR